MVDQIRYLWLDLSKLEHMSNMTERYYYQQIFFIKKQTTNSQLTEQSVMTTQIDGRGLNLSSWLEGQDTIPRPWGGFSTNIADASIYY